MSLKIKSFKVLDFVSGRIRSFCFPPRCIQCGAYLDPGAGDGRSAELGSCFCGLCLEQGFHPVSEPFCTACGLPFKVRSGLDHLCGDCLRSPMKVGRIRAAAEYRGIVSQGIRLFKYHSRISISKAFEQLLFQSFLDHFSADRIDLVVPMPLHRSRMMMRGFNQAFLICRNFERLYRRAYGRPPSWKVSPGCLARTRKTLPQAGFDVESRKKNVKKAFAVKHADQVRGRHILLIDDVLTTGATCNEAAEALLKAGAQRVDALVLARA